MIDSIGSQSVRVLGALNHPLERQSFIPQHNNTEFDSDNVTEVNCFIQFVPEQ